MKLLISLCLSILIISSAFAVDSFFIDPKKSYEIAKSVSDVDDLFDKLGKFGHVYRVKGSSYYVANLPQTSGLPSSQLFIFIEQKDCLRLLAHLPLKYMTYRKSSFSDGKLIISEYTEDTDGMEVVLIINE